MTPLSTMPECLFCRIARREIPAAIVCEEERVMAFLDVMPIRTGHVQIIPKAHFPTFDETPADLAAEILALGQRLARALKRVHAVDRVAFMFTGGDIAHAHAHIVPMVEPTDVTSRRYIAEETVTFRPLPRAAPRSLEETAERLRTLLASA